MAGKNKQTISVRTSEAVDGIVRIFSPKAAYKRKAYRFAYEAIDNTRTRKKRASFGGTADRHLTQLNLSKLREICRDMGRNNPLASGLLETERDGVIGSGVDIQARTTDEGFNEEVEAAWKERMLQGTCDVTGRFNFNQYLGMLYLSYRRDGDAASIFINDKLQAIEGDQIGTPWGTSQKENFKIVNGIAYSNKTNRVIGYYIGVPDRWGFIKGSEFKKYRADIVHHTFNPKRFSQSRGEPVLTPSINFIDTLCDYIDAELVAAKVNACFSMFISRREVDVPDAYTKGISETGVDADDNRLEKMQPGMIMYGEDGEDAKGIGQQRPGALFDPFVLRMLTLIGRPLCMPLMLITLDFSGATFMNARIAYDRVQDAWQREQEWVVKPFVSRVWRWFIANHFPKHADKLAHEIFCKRWPYVDPWKEARADEQQLKNGTISRTEICARQGRDFGEVTKRLGKEETDRNTIGLAGDDSGKKKIMEDLARAVRSGVPIAVKEARAALGLPEDPPSDKLLRFNDQDVLQYHIESGVLTINEVRHVLGLEPVDWGDKPVRKTGISTVKTVKNKEKDAEEEKDEDEEDKK